MSLGVLNNIAAIYAQNNLNQTQSSLQSTLQQLSSGSRINSGADDAAGLAVVNGLQANVASLTQSSQNASDGIGLLQTADGALSQVTNLLNRAVTLATEAANGTLNTNQVSSANQEYQNILTEIGNIGSTTNFNGNSAFSSTAKSVFVSDGTASGANNYSEVTGALSTSSVGLTVGSAVVTTTIPGVSTTLATPTATTASATGGTSTTLAAATIVNTGTVAGTASAISFPTPTSSGAGVSSVATLSPANASNTFSGAFTATVGTGSPITFNITAGSTEAQTESQISGTTGYSASGLTVGHNAGGDLTLTGTAGASKDIVISAASTLQQTTAVTYTASTGTFAAPPTSGSLYTGTIHVAAAGANAAAAITLSSATALGGSTGVVAQLNTAFGTAAGHNVASIGGANNDQLVITGPSTASSNIDTTGTTLTATAGTASVATFSPTGTTDTLSGTISVGVGSGSTLSYTVGSSSTLASVVTGINGTSAFSSAGIVASANSAGQLILTGPAGSGKTLAFASSNSLVDTTAVKTTTSTPPGAGVDFTATGVATLTADSAKTVLTTVTSAIAGVAYQRGVIGANVNELQAASNVASSESVNLTSAQSSIQSTNYGTAASNLAKFKVLSETGISALAQANSVQQEVLKLLQ